MTDQHDEVSAAEERLREAEADLHRQKVVAKLCEHDRLAYASLTDDQLGPMLVTYRHKPIGELHTTSPSALHDWHARPYLPDGTLGEGTGKTYGTARAAAASLIRSREEPGPIQVG